MLISIIILIIGLILCILGFTSVYKKKELNTIIQQKNEELRSDAKILIQECENLKVLIKEKIEECDRIDYQKVILNKAFQSYINILENNYEQKEEEYDMLEEKLQNNYNILQADILKDIRDVKSDLVEIQSTRTAAIEANKKEKEIENNLSFYCVKPTEEELDDIDVLNRIKPKLHQPRILCMLIWSTYYQKPMNTLCNNILGTSVKTGIYKITNQITKQCYIGQAVDIAARWKQHAKCGLGIDTPATNKLYRAMLEDGLHNFSFELLEECSKDLLNEKEKFFIGLYLSNEYGYNGNKGIG